MLKFSGMQLGCGQAHGVVLKRCNSIAACTQPFVLFGVSITSLEIRPVVVFPFNSSFPIAETAKYVYTYVDDGCLAHHSFKTSDSSFLITQRKHSSSLRVDSGVRLGCIDLFNTKTEECKKVSHHQK